jgi:hypothetical protein
VAGIQNKQSGPVTAIGGGGAAGCFDNYYGFVYSLGFNPNNQGRIALPKKGPGAGNTGGAKVLGHQGVTNSVGIAITDDGYNKLEHS